MSTDKLHNTNLTGLAPVHIAYRVIDLYRAGLERGLTETVASVAAVRQLQTELDDLKSADPLNRDTYEHPHGGFTGRERASSTLPRWLIELEET